MGDIDSISASELHHTVDGVGLKHGRKVKAAHRWVMDGTCKMSGRNFIGAIQLRSNLLYTRGRAARGRPQRETKCKHCHAAYESLGHILLRCPFTHEERIQWHDTAVKLARYYFKREGFETVLKKNINTPSGLLKPDIIAWREGACALVTDVTIVSDEEDLDQVHGLKSLKYVGYPEIRVWVGDGPSQ